MKAKQKICLIGGSFDPIHLGHTYIAEKCHRELGMDKIIFLPCKQSPHKLSKKNAPDHHRLKMCQLAVSSLPWAEVDDFDLMAPPPSYSWRTVEAIQSKFPNADLHWLMGTDQWKNIMLWDRPKYLASIVKFIVVTRGNEPNQIDGLSFIKLNGSHSASASQIRKKSRSEQSCAWLNPSVFDYIKEHQLY